MNSKLMNLFKLSILVFFLLFTSKSIYAISAYPGSLDLNFNGIGYITTIFTNNNSFSTDVAIQADGKIVEVGYITHILGITTPEQFAIARFNPDGSPDITFCSGSSKTMTNFSNGGEAFACAIQRDGKIVVVGYSSSSTGDNNMTVIRYNSDGTLDNSFAVNGVYTHPLSITNDDEGLDVVIDNSGNIYVTGYYNDVFALLKLNNLGGSPILQTYSGFSENFSISKISLNSSGKIIVSGTYSNTACIACFNSSDLSIYNAFNSGSSFYRTTPTPSGYSDMNINGLALQSDGKIIIGGYLTFISYYNHANFILLRYNTDGSLDDTFGRHGIEIDSFGLNESIFLYNLTLDQNENIIAVGKMQMAETLLVAKYYNDGTPDETFYYGRAYNNIYGGYKGNNASVAIQNDGKIIVSSYYHYSFIYTPDDIGSHTNNDFLLVRLLGTPPPPTPSLTVWAAALLVLLMLGFGLKFVYKKA